jgi:hypothetical protein
MLELRNDDPKGREVFFNGLNSRERGCAFTA